MPKLAEAPTDAAVIDAPRLIEALAEAVDDPVDGPAFVPRLDDATVWVPTSVEIPDTDALAV